MPKSLELGAGAKAWERKGVAGMRAIVACHPSHTTAIWNCQTMSVTSCGRCSHCMARAAWQCVALTLEGFVEVARSTCGA